VIWLTITQGFAEYVNRNAEALRGKFVMHLGKEKIVIGRPDFHYRSTTNDWVSVFPQFADAIEQRTQPGVRSALECNFSNTTAMDRVCSHIALMDVCQQYFDYLLMNGCGFPRIDLMGTVDDWRLLRAKAEHLKEFLPDGECSEDVAHLSVWLSALLPALDQFVAAAEGHPDLSFWRAVCTLYGASGMSMEEVTGWIGILFPYILGRPHWGLRCWAECFTVAKASDMTKGMDRLRGVGAIKLKDFPSGLSQAPVHVCWMDANIEEDLEFYGGLFALHQHPDGALEVRTGWAVVRPRK
jgi:hypothetical protein